METTNVAADRMTARAMTDTGTLGKIVIVIISRIGNINT